MSVLNNPIYLAACKLCGGAYFVMEGDDAYDNIVKWFVDTPPTKAEVEAEAENLKAEFQATEYQRQRAAEYPPITDYIDGVVKGDQAQIDAYIAACQAVKAKYPKV
jgi:hypothetical protein